MLPSVKMIGKLGLAVASLGCDEPERHQYDRVAFYLMFVYLSHLALELCEITRRTHLWRFDFSEPCVGAGNTRY